MLLKNPHCAPPATFLQVRRRRRERERERDEISLYLWIAVSAFIKGLIFSPCVQMLMECVCTLRACHFLHSHSRRIVRVARILKCHSDSHVICKLLLNTTNHHEHQKQHIFLLYFPHCGNV
jgi:predicted CDP-diglyceride synthetase/phosphatidate cytidylyltransferase